MLRNLPTEDANSSESEQNNGSTTEHFLIALRKTIEKEIDVMVRRTFEKHILPIVDGLVRKVVKEEIQSAQDRFFTHQNRNSVDEATTSRPRTLGLKFLDEVSDSVLTGKEIKGKEGNDIKISLLDNINGLPIISEPEASAKVEILILEAGPNDNICNMSRIDFNNSIIRENDKAKPHFPKSVYVYLEKGIGVLSNVRLGHGACWTKSCKCRLGARVVYAFGGSTVKEAWTKSFMVKDRRCKHNEKHYPPKLSDQVWRLEHIGKDGDPCERLRVAKINTVQEFLFFLNIDPQRLREIIGAGAKNWNTTVDHARQCTIDDKRIHIYSSSTEYKTGVVFDSVGQLTGVLHNCQFFPIESVSESEKDEGRKLLASAFENWNDVERFDDMTSFLHQFPQCISNATNTSGLDSPDCAHIINELLDNAEYTQAPSPVSRSFSDLDNWWENFSDNEVPQPFVISIDDNLPEFPSVESLLGQQTTAVRMRFTVVIMTLQWFFRSRKRVVTQSRVQKRPRRA